MVDQTSALRNALRRLAEPADMNVDASAAYSRTSARRASNAPTSATGAPGADQGKQPAISELTAHRQAARSAARCVNGGSLPSTSTSGRPDACMTGQQCGDGWSRAVPAVPCRVRPRPTVAWRPRRARGSAGTASNEKKDRRAHCLSRDVFLEPAGYLRRDLVNQSGVRPGQALHLSPSLPEKARPPALPAALEAAKY